jgi:hypothetical protein
MARIFTDSLTYSRARKSTAYQDVSFIPVGSVCVESLFSIAAHVFDARRLATLPVHVEDQMFLRANRFLWKHKIND